MKFSIVKYKAVLAFTLLVCSIASYSQVQIDTSNRNVLVVIDDELVGTWASIRNLEGIAPPDKIDRINVLKDKTATNKYGEIATNGVIEIYLKNDNIFQPVEIAAKFPGGSMAWQLFLEKNLNTSVVTNNKGIPGEYKVEVQFVISAEGKLSDFIPVSKNGFGMEEEFIRVLKNSPDWIPCLQNGRNVKCYSKQSVVFRVPEQADRNKDNKEKVN